MSQKVNIPTLAIIDKHIEDVCKKCYGVLDNRSAVKLRFLRDCRIYLELNPSKDTILKQKEITKRKLGIIKERYFDWCENAGKDVFDHRKRTYYNKEFGVYELNRHLRNINFILSIYEEASQ